ARVERPQICPARARLVAAGQTDEAEVVPGEEEGGVGVHGALELRLGILRESLLAKELSELIVQRRRSRIGAQRGDRRFDARVERIARVEELLDEQAVLVRILAL